MGSAVVQGYKLGSFKAIAVATDTEASCSPCGMCRQFLREFCEVRWSWRCETAEYETHILIME